MSAANPEWLVQFWEPNLNRWLPRSVHHTEQAAQAALEQQRKIHKKMKFQLVKQEVQK